jgi:hypothetical protein
MERTQARPREKAPLDLDRVADELRVRNSASSVHPSRSALWMIPFAATLCLEWLARRRRGLR